MIDVAGVTVAFDGVTVLDDIFLRVPSGKTGVVLGKNGTGKSVLLKTIAGLIPCRKGSVSVSSLPDRSGVESRPVPFAYVFQKGGLFDSMDVFDNAAFGMRRRGISEDEVEAKVLSTLERVGLKGSERKLPSELSGGMQKRVGLARALCLDPGVILYDDPTAGLDPVLTDSIAELLLEARDVNSVTSLVVTHDIKFAGKIADDVFLLYKGRFVFSGPGDLFFSRENPYASQFIKGDLDGPIDLM
jgi:phospholipid/cholesterol/gamma-HCH transport system ATP-binding protein